MVIGTLRPLRPMATASPHTVTPDGIAFHGSLTEASPLPSGSVENSSTRARSLSATRALLLVGNIGVRLTLIWHCFSLSYPRCQNSKGMATVRPYQFPSSLRESPPRIRGTQVLTAYPGD